MHKKKGKSKKPATKKSVSKKVKISDKIVKVNDLVKAMTALFYGRSGSGKTTLAGTFPGKKLVLDIGEKGTDSISDKDVSVLEVSEWNDIEEIYWELQSGDLGYDTVIIDSLHSMQDLAILRAKDQANKDHDEQTSQRDYGVAAGFMKTWIVNLRDLRELGIRVVFLAHERINAEDSVDDEVLIPEVGPRLMPSVASVATGSVDIVGHTFISEVITKSKKIGGKSKREISYKVRLGPHGCYTTKVRSPIDVEVPDAIVNPTYDKISKIRKGSFSKPATKTKTKKVTRKK